MLPKEPEFGISLAGGKINTIKTMKLGAYTCSCGIQNQRNTTGMRWGVG